MAPFQTHLFVLDEVLLPVFVLDGVMVQVFGKSSKGLNWMRSYGLQGGLLVINGLPGN